MRTRDVGEVALSVLGLGVVAAVPLALGGGPWLTLLVLALAIAFILSRVWSEQRTYLALRREVYGFHRLVQQLNTLAVELERRDTPEARHRLDEVHASMYESVDRMLEVAGKKEIDLEAAAATPPEPG